MRVMAIPTMAIPTMAIPTKVEDVFRKHIHSLRVCYKHYSGIDYDGHFSSGDALSLDEFVTLLSEADLLDNCLTRQEAGHVFVHSQMFVADEACACTAPPHRRTAAPPHRPVPQRALPRAYKKLPQPTLHLLWLCSPRLR